MSMLNGPLLKFNSAAGGVVVQVLGHCAAPGSRDSEKPMNSFM